MEGSVGVVRGPVGSPRTRSVVGVRGPGVRVFGLPYFRDTNRDCRYSGMNQLVLSLQVS